MAKAQIEGYNLYIEIPGRKNVKYRVVYDYTIQNERDVLAFAEMARHGLKMGLVPVVAIFWPEGG